MQLDVKTTDNSTPPGGLPLPADAPGAGGADYETLLLEHLGFVHRTVGYVARRHALPPWDAEEFEAHVRFRLLADDYAILRKFRGNSRLTTYLTTVIHNLFRDFRIQRWGKWRPSAAAKRMGELGVQLEALLYRDGFSLQEAAGMLRERFDVEASDADLDEMAARLRARTQRRFESDAGLDRLPASQSSDQLVIDGERSATLQRVRDVLQRVLADLPARDRLILKMKFADGMTTAAIAAGLDLHERRIYPQVRRLFSDVRERVESEGVRCEEVLDILDWPGCDLVAGLA